MDTEYKKELPPITATTRLFWDAAKKHQFLLYRCANCGKYYWPAVDCMVCDKPQMEWSPASGRGQVYTFTVMHQLYQPGWKDEVPYNVTWVKLDEGPIFMSNIVGCQNEDIEIGMRVEVVFDDVTDEVTLPKFKPERTSG